MAPRLPPPAYGDQDIDHRKSQSDVDWRTFLSEEVLMRIEMILDTLNQESQSDTNEMLMRIGMILEVLHQGSQSETNWPRFTSDEMLMRIQMILDVILILPKNSSREPNADTVPDSYIDVDESAEDVDMSSTNNCRRYDDQTKRDICNIALGTIVLLMRNRLLGIHLNALQAETQRIRSSGSNLEYQQVTLSDKVSSYLENSSTDQVVPTPTLSHLPRN